MRGTHCRRCNRSWRRGKKGRAARNRCWTTSSAASGRDAGRTRLKWRACKCAPVAFINSGLHTTPCLVVAYSFPARHGVWPGLLCCAERFCFFQWSPVHSPVFWVFLPDCFVCCCRAPSLLKQCPPLPCGFATNRFCPRAVDLRHIALGRGLKTKLTRYSKKGGTAKNEAFHSSHSDILLVVLTSQTAGFVSTCFDSSAVSSAVGVLVCFLLLFSCKTWRNFLPGVVATHLDRYCVTDSSRLVTY